MNLHSWHHAIGYHLSKQRQMYERIVASVNADSSVKPVKIFISHSSRDLAFVQPLVELFEHIGLNTETMFCSSVPGYNVPLDYNIFDYMKEQFYNYDLRVIFVLSENYYRSPACLNEMGAAWVLQHRYTSVLLPGFDFSGSKGVLDQMRILIALNSEKMELKARLNELRDTLIRELGLGRSTAHQNIWERHRDQFIDQVSSTEIYWKAIRQLQESKRPVQEWILPLQKLIEANPASYDAMYMLGTIYRNINDTDNAVKYLKMATKLSRDADIQKKSAQELRQLGYYI